MLERIVEALRGGAHQDRDAMEDRPSADDDRVLAVCALLVEMAMIDGEFKPAERDRIIAIMRQHYGVSESDVARLLEEAQRQARQATDYWRLTRIIAANYSREEKTGIIELLWSVIYADGTVEEHEDYLVKKLARLLELSHTEMIAAKLRSRPS